MLMRPYPLDELVLGDALQKKAETHRTSTFLKFSKGELTYGEVDEMASRMAHGLASHGLRQHGHVAVMLPNGPDFVYVTFALAKLGATVVPINTAYKGQLLRHVLESSDASMLVVDESLLEQVAPLLENLPSLAKVLVRTEGTGTEALAGLQKPATALSRLIDRDRQPPQVAVGHGDLQAIMYTSGTTGPSKGVMVPHAHALTCAADSLQAVDYRPDETIYCPLPIFHAAALWDGVLAALLGGLSIALVERFSASRFWDDVRHFRANVAMGVFSMLPILLKEPATREDKNHSLRSFYVGKSALDEAFYDRFGVRSVETYTSTEVGIATASPYGQWRAGSCGQANHRTHDVRVVDEQDREVGAGEPGQLVVRPRRPFVMTTGYYKHPQATADCFRNLWFHTGDRAYRDADGYFHFLDRIKDSIRRRGENISAFELEREINMHEAVLEAAAFGVPSDLEEDDVKVAVVLRQQADLSAAELAAYCEKRLPAFMIPRYIEFVDELPKTPTGKIAKHELRRQGDHGITPRTWDGDRCRRSKQATTAPR